MRKKQAYIIFLIVLIVGFVLTLNSIWLGQEHANSIVQQQGGSIDTNTYVVYLQESIRIFNGLGIILILIGGLGEVLLFTRGDKFDKQ
ncbi:hypothetical protein Desaci_0355 [Desulfosporosinus acidiphilus SJ4]|uniref:Uncharacterized protein n=1 Tax=Desulfosporosinus acidiphilus (strain DSM 22704 / JCM 16185 / SJ4) TaxID=646529 RepID=I4D0U9_DESAJ|nr:hypothetical protein [Desulfosporosinus acidiphilus]AFM39423.1 hypothetical protein Desaci_0355 [Desulfosporosinus acidiphilus SJ4]